MSHDAHESRQHYGVTFATLAVAAISYALLQSLVAPALPTIEAELNASTTATTWILTAYLLSASVATPILGRLGDMFGKKKMLVVTMWGLVLGTFLAALATSIGVMIFARVIQGIGGAVFPLAFSIIRDEFPRERVAQGIAMISALVGIGGGLGIVLAGPITENLNYHWLFWLPLLAIVPATIVTMVMVPESPIRSPGRIDLPGGVLLAGWLVALLVAVSEGPSWGWGSAATLGLFALAGVLAVAWVVVEQRMAEPLVDMTMLRLRPVWTTNLSATLIGFGMFASFVLIPQFVETPTSTCYGFGASVTEAGLFLLPATVAMLLAGPGRRQDVGDRRLAGAARAGRAGQRAGLGDAGRRPLVELADLRRDLHHGPRHRPGLRLDGQRDRRVGVGRADRRRHRHERDLPQHRRRAGRPDLGQHPDRRRSPSAGFPTEDAFIDSFWLAAGMLLLGFVAALLVPRPNRAGVAEPEPAAAA